MSVSKVLGIFCLALILLVTATGIGFAQDGQPPKPPELPVASILATVPSLPRTETLYFNGLQWGSVNGWNPYSNSTNNSMTIAQQDNARVTMFETPYVYNMIDGTQYPLLAEGPWSWNAARTEITFHIKTAAKWSDGTAVTAADVAYTWASNVMYQTQVGIDYQDYIDTIEVVDPHTVRVKAKLDGGGKAINPLMVPAYLSSNYVIQKAWTQALEARTAGNADAFKGDPAEDVVYSGPYHEYFVDNTKVVLVRNDNYWGKDSSMWGKLPAPKYLAHVIYADNAAGEAALRAGEVDVSQQYNANVQDLWLTDGLPISTYYSDAPYSIGASLPTAFYNLNSNGLDQVAVRKAIAMAVNYNTIIANAMTNQSETFTQAPRSIMNPTPGEQALYDHAAVASLQWAGNDIAGANALLNAAGIIDTNSDGWREYNGQKLSYVATCPNGWTDWQAAIEVVASVGTQIGIEITTNYPEWSEYQTVVTKSDAPLPVGYDIFMMWSDGAGPTQPWGRVRHLISSEFIGQSSNWNGNWGQYSNPAADALIQAIPAETDPAQLKADYTELTQIYLTDIPSFTLMYRPQSFHTVNESVWTNFPHQGDGTNPPVPPLNLTDGYSIAGLYNLNGVPTVTSIVRADSSPTSAASVHFTVTFSESVTEVDANDFALVATDFSGTAISGISGSGATRTVTVITGSGNGTIRLDIPNTATIKDLSGNDLIDLPFTAGESYTITDLLTLSSSALQDGWLLESTETSGTGGTMNSTATTFNLGDATGNRQYRAILHFDTSSLPDAAVITSATLKIKKQGQSGSNPFNILGGLRVDMRKPAFGTATLALTDFKSAAGKKIVATFGTTPASNWYSAILNSAGNLYVNRTGTTQFRLYFATDDNNDNGNDFMKFFSGNYSSAVNRPQLVVEYYIP